MKYNLYVNQYAIVKNKYRLSPDLVMILDVMFYAFASKNFQKHTHNGEVYTWISYNKLIDELPILGSYTKEGQFKKLSKNMMYRKVCKLVDMGFIRKMENSIEMGRTYFSSTDKLESIFAPSEKIQYPPEDIQTPIEEVQYPPCKSSEGTPEDIQTDNNTNYNTTNNKDILSTSDEVNDVSNSPKNNLYKQFLEVFEYFKKVTGKNIYIGSAENRDKPPIKSLVERSDRYKKFVKVIKMGYDVDKMKKVIQYKNEEWKDDSRNKRYIRFATLFATSNFEKYLEEAENAPNLNDHGQSGTNTPNGKENSTRVKLEGKELISYNYLKGRVQDDRFTPEVYAKCFNVQKLQNLTRVKTKTEIVVTIKKAIIESTQAWNKGKLLSDIITLEFNKR